MRYLPSRKDTARKKYGRYQARYTGLDAKEHKAPATFATEQDADAWLASERRLIDLDQWTPPEQRGAQRQRDSLTVGQWLERWLELKKKDLRESTWQVYQRTITNRITGVADAPGTTALVNTPLTELNKSVVVDWWDEISTKFDSPNTNQKAYKNLRTAITDAVERDMLELNPIDIKQARKKAAPKDKELPTTEELLATVEHLSERYQLVGVLCLFMGLRIGEALALKRSHLKNVGTKEAPQWVVSIRGNLQRLQDEQGHTYMHWQEPKTKAGRRDVPIFPRFNDVVERHLEEFVPSNTASFLTTTNKGKVLMDTSFRSSLGRARKAAGVETAITPHYGRNWLITHLAEQGATPAEIGEVLGQTDLKTITEIYMKVRAENVSKVMGRVNDSLAGSGDVVSIAEGRARKARRAKAQAEAM